MLISKLLRNTPSKKTAVKMAVQQSDNTKIRFSKNIFQSKEENYLPYTRKKYNLSYGIFFILIQADDEIPYKCLIAFRHANLMKTINFFYMLLLHTLQQKCNGNSKSKCVFVKEILQTLLFLFFYRYFEVDSDPALSDVALL